MIVTDEWYPDPRVGVSCALPDLRYVLYVAIGIVLIVGAVGVAIVKRIKRVDKNFCKQKGRTKKAANMEAWAIWQS